MQRQEAKVSQVVTAVSCGVGTDWRVLLALREESPGAPRRIDAGGIAQLAAEAKAQGVRWAAHRA